MPKYRKKPVEVEAWQFTKENYNKGAPYPFRHKNVTLWSQYGGDVIEGEIKILECKMKITENDWIVKGVMGEFCTVKPHLFAETYEPVDIVAEMVSARHE